ncbi:hypothetical protein ACWEQ3_51560, partial [Streptomyces mirabilis]
MLTPTPLEELLDLAADVIGCDRRALPAGAAGSPFITLGGGLAQAVRLQARAGRQLGLAVDPAEVERVLEPYGLVLKAGVWY